MNHSLIFPHLRDKIYIRIEGHQIQNITHDFNKILLYELKFFLMMPFHGGVDSAFKASLIREP